MTRPCLACGGLGHPWSWECQGSCCDPCPVCLGSGRVEAKPPARDALADAETLRGEWDALSADYDVPDRFRVSHQTTAHLWQNGMFGSYVIHECCDSATDAARAAFRAVPALRS